MRPDQENLQPIGAAKAPSAKPSIDDGLDPQSLAAIRSLLAEEDAPAAAPHVAAATPAAATAQPPQQAPQQPPRRAPRKADLLPDLEEPPRNAQPAPAAAPKPSLMQRLRPAKPAPQAAPKTAAKPFRIKRKYVAWAAAALFVVLRPWTVVLAFFLLLFVVIGAFLALGYDGFWRRVMALGHWYARRRPERSAELHRKLDNFAMKWDAFLDRFPEGTVDGLYMPDFGELAEADARHEEALERRLSGLRNNSAGA
ncbi:MAG: hypothetical protein ACSHWZ_19080 [Sulfitobacter sp.]